MDNIRMSARVCAGSFRRIVCMPRFYVAFLWLFFLWFPLMSSIRTFSEAVEIGMSPLLIVRLARFSVGYYFAPLLWMDLSNYKWHGYGYGPSFGYVYGVLLGCIIVCMILSMAGIRRKDLNFAEEV